MLQNVGRGTSLGYLPPLGKYFASLEKVEWQVLGDQCRGMAFPKSHEYCTVSGSVPKMSRLTVFRKER